MKIRLAILEKDHYYLKRIISVFGSKYSDQFEIYSFTDEEVAYSTLDSAKIDVFVAGDTFEIDMKRIPKRCSFAYLVDSDDIETIHNQKIICKFQKVDLIYKQLLNLYSENSTYITGMHIEGNDNTIVLAFLSPAGGTGCSTAAAACAMNFAKKGKKVLFLSLEKFGSSDAFFNGEGNSSFSDVIYAIKSKKSNLPLKLESTVKQDPSGVYFYSEARTALDMQELKSSEIKKLIDDLKLFGNYDYIILDFDFNLSQDTLDVLQICNRIVMMSDGSYLANKKLEKAITTLSIIEQQSDYKLLLKTGILFNRVSSQTSEKPNLPEITEFGGIKRYEGYKTGQMLKELSDLSVFDSLS